MTLKLDPSLDALRPALAGVRSTLAPSLTAEEWHAVELILMETLTNIVRHAAPRSPIALALRTAPDGLFVTIEDDGLPMPGGAVPEGRLPVDEPTPATASEHGYGWFLIRALARDIAYDRIGRRNRLTFRVGIGVPA